MADWRSEVRSNRRLQAGLLLAGLLVWVAALLTLDEAVGQQEKQRLRAAREWARLEQLREADQWPQIQQEAVNLLARYRERAWREESEGRLQAVLQDWLNQQLAELGLRASEMEVRIESADAAAGQPSLPAEFRVGRARLRLNTDVARLADLLALVESDPRWLWIDQLQWRAGQPASVELQVNALFLVGARMEVE